VQAAGDLLFVPTSWHHSAVNERLTAAVSVTIGAPLSWQEIFRRHPE
jgi:ribosomal protein L16 Arg81 hydroxylase